MAPGVTKVSNGGPLTTHSAGKFQVTTAGPYFTSGEIKFSVLRSLFKEETSGAVKASELRRVTSTSETNPIVPDSTQNAQISTENNLSMSQFRGSVKRYYADSISDGDQVHLNHYDGNNGIDWSNGGTSGADGSAANNNLSKNIQKFVHWLNTAYSSDNDGGDGGSAENKNGTGLGKIPAMSLEPAISGGAYGVYNLQLNVSGKIYGAAGRGGYKNQTNNTDTRRGKAGGTALKISHSGSTTVVYVENGARIHGGGGGAEQGEMGADGKRGQCIRKVFTTISGGCGGGTPSCPTDYTRVSNSTSKCGTAQSNCRRQRGGATICDEVDLYETTIVCQGNIGEPGPEPIRGVGGKGGDGAGWLDGQYRSNGRNGEFGTLNIFPDCPGDMIPSGRVAAGDGGRGGNGGAPGRAGQYTTSPDRGGSGGAAICGNNFSVQGNKNSKTLKVRYDGSCIGETSENAGSPPGLPGLSLEQEPSYVRFKGVGGVTDILVTAPGGQKTSFGVKYEWRDLTGTGDVHLDQFRFQGKDYKRRGTDGDTQENYNLLTGIYPIEWTNLNDDNTAGNNPYPRVSITLMDPQMRSGALGRLGLSRNGNIEEMNVLGLRDSDGNDANGAIMIYKGNTSTPYPPATIKYKLTSDLDNPITNVTGSSDRGDPLFNIPNDFPAPGQEKIYTYSWRPVKYTPIKYTITATGPGGTSKIEFTIV